MRRGFTLVETIFASVLFGFIVLFVLNLYPSSLVAVRRGETQIIADNFAQAILEDVRSRSFYNLGLGSTSVTYTKWTYGDVDYLPTVDIAYDNDLSIDTRDYLKVATVTINWKFQHRDNSVVHKMYLHCVNR